MAGFINIPKIDALKLDDTSHLIKMLEYYVNQFCLEYKIDDITGISENRFNACLTYIYNHYYKLSLYTDKKRAPAIDSVIDYTNIKQLYAIFNSYLYICNVCDKIPSLSGFSFLTGISLNAFYRWRRDYENQNIYNTDSDNTDNDSIENSLYIFDSINNSINNINNNNSNNIYINYDFINSIDSIKDKTVYNRHLIKYRYTIINELIVYNENALADRLASGKGSQVGIIAILNHRYNWSNNNAPDLQVNAPQISLADLPTLEDNSKNN